MTRTVTKPKKIWDNFVEVGEIQKSGSIKFVVAIAARDGIKYVNIREFYIRKRDNVWMPGRDGITIPVTVPLKKGAELIQPLGEMQELLKKATDLLEDFELYDDANARWYYPEEKKND